jgi:hypothetical protein
MDRKIDATYLLEHPVPISIATGLVNGIIFKLRNKNLELKTVATLAAVQGAGEAILVMYEKPQDRGPILGNMELWEIGLYSAIGTIVGMLPFMSFRSAPALAPAASGFGIPALANASRPRATHRRARRYA